MDDLPKPHSVSFVVNVTYNTVSGPVTRDITVFADLFSATTTDDGAPVNPQYFYEFTFVNLGGNDISQIPDDAVINTSIFTLNDNEPLVIGPSFSPVDGTQLWVHLQAQLGHGDYARTSVTFWKVDDDNNQIPGTLESYNVGLNNDDENADTKYRTFKFTPVSGNGRYAVTFIRTNNSNDHSILKVEAVHIVRTRTNVVYPNDTLVTVTVTATERATSARERKYNALITRHVISYNLATQTVDYTERPSRSFADAVLHTWLKMGGQPESSIDIYELYSIAASLTDQRLGYFDYTFDDEDISLGSRIQTICDAATVTAFWDGGVLSFTRDERKPSATTVFIYDANQQDGYIVARNGNNFDTSERIEWAGDMFIVVTDANGSPTARVQAYPRSDTTFGFTAAVPAINLNIFDGYNVQSPSRYVIASQVEMDATKWTITEKKPNGDGTTSLTMSEYNDEMYNYEVTE
ncbi:TPA: host specificity factor TipJ family phage tail protein [Serratia marcescens]